MQASFTNMIIQIFFYKLLFVLLYSTSQLLVEGGGSYYHLNHSELVSLLLQRDAELRQEREEYEHRGLLLEKREVELKKMKVIIRDLEDYIDTLLVRIMEQTPALLQVRSKMK